MIRTAVDPQCTLTSRSYFFCFFCADGYIHRPDLCTACCSHYLHTSTSTSTSSAPLSSTSHLISSNRSHLISRGFLSLFVSCICARSIHYRPASSSPSFHTKSHKCMAYQEQHLLPEGGDHRTEEDQIIELMAMEGSGKMFEDTDFIPNRQSLYDNEGFIPYYDTDVTNFIVWKRPHEFCSFPCYFHDSFDVPSVVQGT